MGEVLAGPGTVNGDIIKHWQKRAGILYEELHQIFVMEALSHGSSNETAMTYADNRLKDILEDVEEQEG